MTARAAVALAAVVVVVIVIVSRPPAAADTPEDRPAIDADRADHPAAPGRSELGFDGGAPLDGWGVTASAGWLAEPLALDGGVPVRRRQTFGLGAAVALGAAVVVDGRFAVAHQVGDRLRPIDPRPLDRFVPGDLAIGARLRVTGTPERAVFVRGDLTLPTGDDRDFAGEASWTLAWRLIGRATLGGVAVAASAGIRLRGAEVAIGDRLAGNEMLGALGVAVPLPAIRPLWCAAGQVALTAEAVAVIGDDVGAGRGPSPAEARLGAVVRPWPGLAVAVRAGLGLRDQLGAPAYRAAVELTFQGRGRLIDPTAPPPAIETDDED